MFCRQQVAALSEVRPRLRALGAEVAVVGPSEVAHIAGFRAITRYEGPLFVDPSLRAFTEAGLGHGLGKTLHPLTFVRAFKALAGGFRQGATRGDPVQLGGTVLLGRGSVVQFAGRDRFAGDLSEGEDVLRVVDGAIAGRDGG